MVGSVIGPYRIVRLLGEGGMASVYEGVNESMERRVAIKVLHQAVARRSEVVDRFLNEARAVNRIGHPSIVQIQEQGHSDDGIPYVVMEFLDGETLSQRLLQSGGRLELQSALEIIWQVAAALAAAHAKNIVHRDLNPRNLMLVPDPLGPGGERVKVLDFGIAKLVEGGEPGSAAGPLIMGTPTYMSPEQWDESGTVDAKTDVYALGVILFELVAGRPPFVGDDAKALMGMHLFQLPTPLAAFSTEVSPELTAFAARLLSKAPAERPSMAEAADALGELGAAVAGSTLVGMPKRLTAAGPIVTGAHLTPRSAATSPSPAKSPAQAPAPESRQALLPQLRWRRMAAAACIGGGLMAGLVGLVALSLSGPRPLPDRPSPIDVTTALRDGGEPSDLLSPVDGSAPQVVSASQVMEFAPSLPPQVAAEALEQARLFYRQGDFGQAKNAASLASSGQLPEAWELLGQVACQQRDESAVSAAYRNASTLGREKIIATCRQKSLVLLNDSEFTFQMVKPSELPPLSPPVATPPPAAPPSAPRPVVRPSPPPVATSTNADRVLSDAQRENLQHNYAHALQLARSVQKESPLRAWRVIGSAACGLKDLNLVKEAYQRLDLSGRQYMFFVCQRSGINTATLVGEPKN